MAMAEGGEESIDFDDIGSLKAAFVEQTAEFHVAYRAIRPNIRAPLNFEALARVCTAASPYDQDEISAVSNAVRYELNDAESIKALDLLQSKLFPPIEAGNALLPRDADQLADQYGWTMLTNRTAIPKSDAANYKRIFDANGTLLQEILLERENKLGKHAPGWVKTAGIVSDANRNPITDLSVASASGSRIPGPALIVRAHQRRVDSKKMAGAAALLARPITNIPRSKDVFDEESAVEDEVDLSELESHIGDVESQNKKTKNKPKKTEMKTKPAASDTVQRILDFEKARIEVAKAAHTPAVPQPTKPTQAPGFLNRGVSAFYTLGSTIVEGAYNLLVKNANDDPRVSFSVHFVKDERTICTIEIIPAPRALQSIGNSIFGYLIESIDPNTGVMKLLDVDIDKIVGMEATLEHSVTLHAFNDPKTNQPGLKVDLKKPFFEQTQTMHLAQNFWALNVWSMINHKEEDLKRSWVAVVVENADYEPIADSDLLYYRLMAARHIAPFLKKKSGNEVGGRVYFFPYAIRMPNPAPVKPTYTVTEDPSQTVWETNADNMRYKFFWPIVRKGTTKQSRIAKKTPHAITMYWEKPEDKKERLCVFYNDGIPIFAKDRTAVDTEDDKGTNEDAEEADKEKSINDGIASFFRVGEKRPEGAPKLPKNRR